MNHHLLFLLPVIFFSSRSANGLKRCGIVDTTPDPTYHLVRPCSRSKMTLVGSANTKTLQQCQRYAASKKALALNYNPSGDFQDEPSCLLLDCPEFKEEISLAQDDVYDYYSLYADPMPDSNVSCVPKVGMFKLHKEKMNFSAAQDICAEEGGYLANVLSEQKTNALSGLLGSVYSGRGKHLAYVGLHDMDMEGQYINMKDEPLDCFTWRAWAPNQPRSKYKTEDCVVLTTDKNWKVVNCTIQMPFLCELQAQGPYDLCEEKPAYCELGDGPPGIPSGPDDQAQPLPDTGDHTGFPDIIEIPIPGIGSVNGTDQEIEVIDIKNTTDSGNKHTKDEKVPGREKETNDGRPGNTTNPEDFSGNTDTQQGFGKPGGQDNIQYNTKPSPVGNEQSQGYDINGWTPDSGPSQNPTSSGNGNQWNPNQIRDPNSNKWRPIQGSQNSDQNWKPNVNGENNTRNPGQNGWRPVLNPTNTKPSNGNGSQTVQNGNGNSTAMPSPQNTWRPNNEGNTIWRPNNQETGDPQANPEHPQDSLWVPHHPNMGGNNQEHNQDGNGNKIESHKPQNPNNNKPNGGGDFENFKPEEHGEWRPDQNPWRPQIPSDQDNSNENNWRPGNFDDGDTKEQNPDWRPQNTENRDPNENDNWRPQNNNWRPENSGDDGPNGQFPGGRPQNNGNTYPIENNNLRPQNNKNNWRPDSSGDNSPSEEIPGWKAQNNGNRYPDENNDWRPQNNNWRPENSGDDGLSQQQGERPQNNDNRHPNENNNLQNNNNNNWRPDTSGDNSPSEEIPGWKPQNNGSRYPNENNDWKPQNNNWRPDSSGDDGPSQQLLGGRPQNNDNRHPNENNNLQNNNNNWRPDSSVDITPSEEIPGWRPQNNGNRYPNENENWRPQNNNWRPEISGDDGPSEGHPGKRPQDNGNKYPNENKWRPQNNEDEETHGLFLDNFDENYQNWRPNDSGNGNADDQQTGWRPQHNENSQNENNDWRPQENQPGSDDQKEQSWRPSDFEDKDPNEQQPPEWTPQNNGNRDPKENKRPQNNEDEPIPDQHSPDEDNNWKPGVFQGQNPEQQTGWHPQNTENGDPNTNDWRPHIGDGQNHHECNEWTQNTGNRQPFNDDDNFRPGQSYLDQSFTNCNQKEWVPQNHHSGNTEGEKQKPWKSRPENGIEENRNQTHANNQNSESNIDTNQQNRNSGYNIGSRGHNKSSNFLQNGNGETPKFQEITSTANSLGQYNPNMGRSNEAKSGPLQNTPSPKVRPQITGEKRNETRSSFNINANNDRETTKALMNYADDEHLFSARNKSDTKIRGPIYMTQKNERDSKTQRSSYDHHGDESFVMEESQKTYKTSKASLKNNNTRTENNVEQSANKNKDNKDEEPSAPEVIKVRDRRTKKCKSVTYEPKRN